MITCNWEDGDPALLRHVTTAAIVMNDKNEVLLLKRSATITNPNRLTIPGGFLDRDETTEEGVLRELREETGFEGKIKMLFEIVDKPNRPKEDRQNVEFRYIVELTGGKEKIAPEEVAYLKWYSENDLPSDEKFAFDHLPTLKRYYEYLRKPFPLPIMTSK